MARTSAAARPLMIATMARRRDSSRSGSAAPSASRAVAGSRTMGDSVPSKSANRPAGERDRADAARSAAARSCGVIGRLAGVRRFLSPGLLVPLLLALVGASLIIASRLPLDAPPVPSLPPIARPTPTALPSAPSTTPTPRDTGLPSSPSPSVSASPTAPPTATAVQIQVETMPKDINLRVRKSASAADDAFPPLDAAYILSSSSQPGRGTNSYIVAHARLGLFKNLWNVQLGAQVLVMMSDGSRLAYRVTEVHANVACPDPTPENPQLNPPRPPLALQIHHDCSEGRFWTAPTAHERLTLQTSQGYNRNWGEWVVVAELAASR